MITKLRLRRDQRTGQTRKWSRIRACSMVCCNRRDAPCAASRDRYLQWMQKHGPGRPCFRRVFVHISNVFNHFRTVPLHICMRDFLPYFSTLLTSRERTFAPTAAIFQRVPRTGKLDLPYACSQTGSRGRRAYGRSVRRGARRSILWYVHYRYGVPRLTTRH